LIQPFGRLDRDAALGKLSFLSLLALIVFGLIAGQLAINSAKIMVRVNPPWSFVRRRLNDLIGTLSGGLSRESRAQGSSVRCVPFAQGHYMGRL